MVCSIVQYEPPKLQEYSMINQNCNNIVLATKIPTIQYKAPKLLQYTINCHNSTIRTMKHAIIRHELPKLQKYGMNHQLLQFSGSLIVATLLVHTELVQF